MEPIRARHFDIPGKLYKRNERWWWKVQLPGELHAKRRALKPIDAHSATTDYSQARQIALNLWQEALYINTEPEPTSQVTSVASLIGAYLKHCDRYYLDDQMQPNKETVQIRYSVRPLLDLFAGLSVTEFGPLRLVELRDYMIELDWSMR